MYDDTPIFKAIRRDLLDDTPYFHELVDEAERQHRLADTLLAAIYADHDDHHDGAIRWCSEGACRAAWALAHAA